MQIGGSVHTGAGGGSVHTGDHAIDEIRIVRPEAVESVRFGVSGDERKLLGRVAAAVEGEEPVLLELYVGIGVERQRPVGPGRVVEVT